MRARAVAMVLAAATWSPTAALAQPRPALAVGEEVGSEIKIVEAAPRFRHHVRVRETAGADLAGLSIEAHLIAPDVSPIRVAIEVGGRPYTAPVTVPALGAAEVTLDAPIALTGTYSGALVLSAKPSIEKPVIVRLEVTRDPSKLPVTLSAPPTVAGEGASASLRAIVRETAGRPLKDLGLELDVLSCRAGDGAPVDVDDAKVSARERFDLAARGRTREIIAVQKLPAAGECEAELALTIDRAEVVRKPVKLQLRRHLLWGLIAVLVGVACGLVLRVVSSIVLPGLERRRRAVVARDRLKAYASGASLHGEELRLVNGLEARLRALYGGGLQDLFQRGERGKAIDVVERKIDALFPLWVRVHRRRAAVLLTQEGAVAVIDDALRAAAEALTGDQGTEETIDSLVNGLQTAEGQLIKLIDEQLVAPLEALHDDVVARLDHAGAPSVGDPLPALNDAQRDALGDTKSLIERAREAWGAKEYALARERLDEARGRYARVLAETLLAAMPAQMPAGFSDAAAWQELQEEVRRRLAAIDRAEGEAAVAQYQGAHGAYVSALAGALREVIRALAGQVNHLGTLAPERKQVLGKRLDDAQRTLDDVAAALRARNAGAADRAYQEAGWHVAAVRAEIEKLGVQLDGAQERLVASVVAGTDHGTITAPPSESAPAMPDLGSFDRDATRVELALSVGLLVVAVASGVQALNLRGPTWGSNTDVFVAFLWGLGVYGAGGAAFAGLSAVRRQFSDL